MENFKFSQVKESEDPLATARVPLGCSRERLPQGDHAIPEGKALIDYEDAVEVLSEDERFKATLYAMNTLLIEKGVYSAEEFRFQFRQSAQKQLRRRKG